jgi:hypothetical protein
MRRFLALLRSMACVSVLAVVVLGALASGAAAAEKPGIDKPVDQFSTVNEAIVPLKITGKHLASLKVTGLPEGLKLKEPTAETEATIEGTPTALGAVTVTLEATNETEPETVQFKWTVETAPTIGTVGTPQRSTVDQTIEPLVIKGTNLASVTANETLPAGLEVEERNETEFAIKGTPHAVQSKEVTLEAANKAGHRAAPVHFEWIIEAAPTIKRPADQASAVGQPVELTIEGTNLFGLTPERLPAGLKLGKSSETARTITGTATTPAAATVRLKATNHAGGAPVAVEFQWSVREAEKAASKVETPAKPPESSGPPPPTTIPSAGRLGTLPVQKPGKSLTASFLCEVASCKVQVTATITAGKKKFKIHSARTPIAQGQKSKIALKLSKAQQALVAAALKKHKKVTAALSASITSSVGFQVTKALVIAVKR